LFTTLHFLFTYIRKINGVAKHRPGPWPNWVDRTEIAAICWLRGGPRDAAVHFDTYRILQRLNGIVRFL